MLAKQQEASLENMNNETARLVVERSEHDAEKKELYIQEYKSLLEKYNSACIVRSTREEIVLNEKEAIAEQVSISTGHVKFNNLA